METVHQLRDNTEQWNIPLVKAIYGPTESNKVLNTTFSYTGADDWLAWTKSALGSYSVKQGYQILTQDGTNGNSTEAFWKIF